MGYDNINENDYVRGIRDCETMPGEKVNLTATVDCATLRLWFLLDEFSKQTPVYWSPYIEQDFINQMKRKQALRDAETEGELPTPLGPDEYNVVQVTEAAYEHLVGADVREAIDNPSFLEARSASTTTDASAQSSDATRKESTSTPATSECSSK